MSNEIEEIVLEMMELGKEIEKEEAILSDLRRRLYSCKDKIKELRPDENADIVEFLTKQKLIKELKYGERV